MKFKFKFFKVVLACFIVSGSGLAHAGLIDNGDYTTVDGLDWLDFGFTSNMTQSAALLANTGWRTATRIEMQNVMNAMFETNFGWTSLGATNSTSTPRGTINANRFNLWFSGGSITYQATVEGIGKMGTGGSAVYAGYDGGIGSPLAAVDFHTAGSGIALVRSASPVPEPTTLAIFALGLMGLASRRFKKQS